MTTFYGFLLNKTGKQRCATSQPTLHWALFCLFLVSLVGKTGHAQTFPASFSQVQVVNGLSSPTVAAFAPDGRIFVAEQAGTLRIIKNGNLLPTPFVQLSVDPSGERGLIGFVFDPNFNSNHYVYVYYTVPGTPAHNRVSRFTANGDVALANSETILLELDNLSSATNHNGGSMAFGKDGKLYIGVGENANADNSQILDNYLGKVLRINSDGSIPSDNPFQTGSVAKRSIWAYGLRNPYTITVQPVTGRLFVNDVGAGTWEEINDATTGGLNFGWPSAEGNSSNTAFANPVYAYGHGNGDGIGCAITGGTFFNPTNTNYPASFVGKYFYQDFCSNWINVLDLSTTPATRASFATGLPANALSILTGPDGNLYYLSIATGALYKIMYNSPNPDPGTFAITGVTMVNCATVSAGQRSVSLNPQYAGLSGQPVSFSIANEFPATTNPGPYTLTLYTDNPTITLKATQKGTSGAASFTYNWLAACTGGSAPNTPPTVAASIPNQSATVGQNVSFSIPAGTFTDAETPNNLTYSVSGLPAGLAFSAPSTITGVPSASGVSMVTVTAKDPGNLSVSTTFTITVNPGSTPNPGTFAITGATLVNCTTISPGKRSLSLTPQYSGVTGQPISFSVANEMLPTTNPGPYTLTLYTDNPIITLKAVQSGTAGEASFSYNWLALCNGGARQGVESSSSLRIVVLGNPAVNETVEIDIQGATGESLRLQMLDQQGRPVSERNLQEVGATERLTMPLGKSSGMYFLQATTSTQREVVKISKP